MKNFRYMDVKEQISTLRNKRVVTASMERDRLVKKVTAAVNELNALMSVAGLDDDKYRLVCGLKNVKA